MTATPDPGAPAAAPPSISVMVVEDDVGQRDAFVDMVCAATDLTLHAAVDSLRAAIEVLDARGPPDVVVLDLGLPDGDGTAVIQYLRHRSASAAVLVATAFGDEAHVVRAIESGAQGYLLKDSPMADFVKAVRLVHEGSAPLSPKVASHLLKRLAAARPSPRRAAAGRHERLSAREVQILTLIAQGYLVPEVAKALQLSTHTVTSHVKHIYEKLAVSNRVQAVNTARATGQIE